MSGYLLRKNDFPNGISTADDVDRLGALLNPYLTQLSTLVSNGVNVAKNLDAQVVLASAGASAGFPMKVRIKDGRKPIGVLLLSVQDAQSGGPAVTSPSVQWTYSGQTPGTSNLVTIDNVSGLTVGRNYSLTFLVLFA